ncbi:MAG TPA: tRNA (adenosine(37)-N6)-threonylcarbamoyltransferase complex ATPase subunit type 1 TsaE [Gemmatimonadaceae bacterium]|nr:tRNA (adenosine(37)-N6)-threonylcarbamoyltransferase complex ATPase subunit type 1 TsaE [Gemmatimonadaceae bacterium]
MPVAELTEPELAAWGDRFGRELSLPACVVLEGDLGAGKTTLVRAIARAQGALEPVTSPTFSLVHEYHSPRGQVFHLDLYRLKGPEQLAQLGWEDIVREGGLMLVEWPDRARGALPADHITLRLEHVPGKADVRRLTW